MKSTSDDFYVYALYRNEGDNPFYIGKGCNGRINRHESHARNYPDCHHHVCRIIRKVWREGREIVKRKLYEQLTEQDAFDLEIATIADGKALGWTLANATAGGEGVCGYVYTPEQLARKVERARTMMSDPIIAQRVREAQKRYWQNPENCKRQGEIFKEMWADPAFREKQMQFLNSPEFQEKRLEGAHKTKNFKTYDGVIAPDGTVYSPIHNMRVFCKEHGLDHVCMLDVANGKLFQYKGWKSVVPFGRVLKKQLPRTYQSTPFLSPQGVIYSDIQDFFLFCSEHSLRVNPMLNLEAGIVTTHKGWTIYPPRPPKPMTKTYFGPGFVSPNGTSYADIPSLSAFCREHKLDLGTMRKIAHGRGRSKTYKGWKRYDPP